MRKVIERSKQKNIKIKVLITLTTQKLEEKKLSFAKFFFNFLMSPFLGQKSLSGRMRTRCPK